MQAAVVETLEDTLVWTNDIGMAPKQLGPAVVVRRIPKHKHLRIKVCIPACVRVFLRTRVRSCVYACIRACTAANALLCVRVLQQLQCQMSCMRVVVPPSPRLLNVPNPVQSTV